MEERKWHYLSGEDQIGPVEETELKSKLADGSLPWSTYVWAAGMADWRPASQVPELGGTEILQAAASYEMTPRTRPTPVTVFGILNIVFGGLTLLCSPFGAISLIMPQPGGGMQQTPEMKLFLGISIVVGMIMAAFLLASGVGLLYLRRWSRLMAYWYGWVAVAWGIISFIINITLIIPQFSQGSEEAAAMMVGGMCGGICGGLFGLIYPILLIIFMRRPNVVEACQR